ncbi:hypothetical protein PODOV061v2_0058 [Vibrio phage 172P1]|nr:hypothetical protein PODOV061v2_0058 [Vibrio phage 172P1]
MPRLTIHTKNEVEFEVDEGCFCCLGRDECDEEQLARSYRNAFNAKYGTNLTSDQAWGEPCNEAECITLQLRSLHSYDGLAPVEAIFKYIMNESPWSDAIHSFDAAQCIKAEEVELNPDCDAEYMVNAASVIRRAYALAEPFNKYVEEGATTHEAMLACIIHNCGYGHSHGMIGDGHHDESIINIEYWTMGQLNQFLDGSLRPESGHGKSWNELRGYPQNILDQWYTADKEGDVYWYDRTFKSTSTLDVNAQGVLHRHGDAITSEAAAESMLAGHTVDLECMTARVLGFTANPVLEVKQGTFRNYFTVSNADAVSPAKTIETLKGFQHA